MKEVIENEINNELKAISGLKAQDRQLTELVLRRIKERLPRALEEAQEKTKKQETNWFIANGFSS